MEQNFHFLRIYGKILDIQGVGEMKSLQVVTPYVKCIFNCPFCIAKGQTHHNDFENIYEKDHELWKERLIDTIAYDEELKYVVITGNNEPMQTKECVREITDMVRSVRSDIQIEIQTRYYAPDEVYDSLDVVAYSISHPYMLQRIVPKGRIKRYVIILTDKFNNYRLADFINLIPSEVSQLTFKVLQDSNGVNPQIDEYIHNHSLSEATLMNLAEDIQNYRGDKSIFLDTNCMDSVGRYKIFREDGNVYSTWEEKEPESSLRLV